MMRMWGMPGHVVPTKDADPQRKGRGVAVTQRSDRVRMGQPTQREAGYPLRREVSRGTETSQYPEETEYRPE